MTSVRTPQPFPECHPSAPWTNRGAGNVLTALYNDTGVVVYQAYKPSIGRWALENQRLGGPEFSFARMSWIKPNFTWMAHRCGWASKRDQEVVLAIHITRDCFDAILQQAIHSSYIPELYGTKAAWDTARNGSDVVMQWDPDHVPFTGEKLQRRYIQLGLRGQALAMLGGPAVLKIEDASDCMRRLAALRPPVEGLMLPQELPYPVNDDVRRKVQLSNTEADQQ